MSKKIKLSEIAARINAHLQRFECDKTINEPYGEHKCVSYYNANSWASGNRVGVRYISFQGETYLPRAKALAYLEWLDAGNVGRHYEQQRASTKAIDEEGGA